MIIYSITNIVSCKSLKHLVIENVISFIKFIIRNINILNGRIGFFRYFSLFRKTHKYDKVIFCEGLFVRSLQKQRVVNVKD